jgi:hypothetical protein
VEAEVAVPEGVLVQHVADETVLLHLESGMYYGLDAVGTRMLDLACSLPDDEAVVHQLAQEYDVSADVLQHDLADLLSQLVEKGLIVRRTSEHGAASGAGPRDGPTEGGCQR